ncbi:MAG: response regulator [Methylobacter sp.]|nr:MAG: response regulator [Methylobacter sp.]
MLPNRSIKFKLMFITVFSSTVALLAFSAVLFFYELTFVEKNLINALQTQADIITENSLASLAFMDESTTKKTLSALRYNSDILYAGIYDKSQNLLASYQKNAYQTPVILSADDLHNGVQFIKSEHFFQIIQAVRLDNELLGYLLLRGSFESLYNKLYSFALTVLLAFGIALLVALSMSLRLQRIISQPIIRVAKFINRVTESKTYTVRAKKETNDELGLLVVAFNRMLEQLDASLQKRDEAEQALAHHLEHLQETINEQTKDLQLVAATAEAANRAKSNFLANMSHEIRTPMNAIMGMTHLALQSELTAKQRNYLDKIDTSAKWLLGVLNDILDFSKLEAGKLKLEHAEFRLETVMQYLSDVTSSLLEAKPLTLNFEVEPDVPTALIGDSLRLGQVLLNLLSNAIKFTEQGSVTIQVQLLAFEEKQAYLRFGVIDTGIGLSEEQQDHLFEAFNQADNSTTRKYGGTGLGLAISKDLVTAMGGTIGIESRLGFGSTFYFTVLLDVQPLTALNPPPPQTLTPAPCLRLNDVYLLLVEDNIPIQEMMLEILSHNGIVKVDLAGNGAEAVKLVGEHDYSVVLMDCQMPVMDGFEATRLIRADSRFADLPIIAMTGNVMTENQDRCLACGMNDFISKPIESELFFQTLARWVKSADRQPIPTTPSSDINIGPGKYPMLENTYLLLVDDNPVNREMMPEILGYEGIRVDLAGNGAEAITMIGEHDYSAVLMDCQMPVMDGFEATRIIRADPRFTNLPIIAMTGNIMTENRDRCLACGMNDHIAKPFDWDLFFQTLVRWVKPQNTVGLVKVIENLSGMDLVFPVLTGIDQDAAKTLTGNDVALYRKMLILFRANHADDIALIGAAYRAGDNKTAERLAHKLMGGANSIAMPRFSGLIIELEQALKQYNDIAMESLLEKTGAVLAGLVNEIDRLLFPFSEIATLPQVVAEVVALLATDCFVSDELLSQVKMLFPDNQLSSYNRLVQHILDTDYAKAQAVLNAQLGLSNEKVEITAQDRRPTILVVDDKRVNREILVSFLNHDYQVKVACNGQRALDIAQHSLHTDLILLDIDMPKMDGYEVLRRLQENLRTRDIPVIFVTAASDKESETYGLQLGAVDYIAKPISPDIVLLRVRNQVLLKQHEKELKRSAHYDSLTGIPNRVLLAERMKQAIAQTKREQKMLGVCYLDLDGFKLVNDTFGHQVGDHVLNAIARRIGSILRKSDTVARLGGDEFVILLPDLSCEEECTASLMRVLEIIAQPIVIQDRSISLGASIGVSIFPGDDNDPDVLLRHADQAMYVAKQLGKNRYHLFDPSYEQKSRSCHEIMLRIEQGLDNQEFEFYYQPKVDLVTRKVVCAEALIRWNHPERGLLLPDDFLNNICHSELEIRLGEWAIDTALSQLMQWREAGFAMDVSVNIAACHLQSEGFVEYLERSLAGYPELPVGCLHIEILETAAIEDFAKVSATMEACRLKGVRFALDDFGTGYSSLSYLHSLPVDTLKIDQSFVRDMLVDKGDKAIVQAIIVLAKTFGLSTVAEGIETMEQFDALLVMGCEFGQGYAIASPMSAAAFVAENRRFLMQT